VVRIWSQTASGSVSLSVQGMHFSGLVCIGDNLMMSILQYLQPNSLVFKLHGHFFVASESFKGEARVAKVRYAALPACLNLPGKQSYGKTSLAKMQRTLRALKQIHIGNERLKSEILGRGLDPSSTDVTVQAAQSTSLRQQIFNKQVKQPGTKRKETILLKKIEVIKLRLSLLKEEKESIVNELDGRKAQFDTNLFEADKSIDEMTEKFHNLSKDKEKLSDWMKTFDEFRGYNEKTSSELVTRRKQLISQLIEIFPISEPTSSLPTIGYVCLPETDNLKEREDNEVSVSLGWTAHITLMISSLLTVPTRYQINHLGSRSCMVDYILDKIPERERTFPLYPKGVERTRFEYAVYLLNKNIAQLRWHCDESTPDLRTTLKNLHHLLTLLTTREPFLSSPAIRLNLPHAPPVLSGVATVLCRGTPPGSSSKTLLDPDLKYASNLELNDTDQSPNDQQLTLESSDEAGKSDPEDEPVEPLIESSSSSSAEDSPHVDQILAVESQVSLEDEPRILLLQDNILSISSESCVNAEDDGLSGEGFPERRVEVGMAADKFWDSVTSRAQVLSVPASFKTTKQKSFRQF